MQTTTGQAGRVNAVRQANHWTIAHLARVAGASRAAAWSWVHGRVTSISDKHLARIADAAGVSLIWLMTGHDPAEPRLNDLEVRLVEGFRELTPNWQAYFLRGIALASEADD